MQVHSLFENVCSVQFAGCCNVGKSVIFIRTKEDTTWGGVFLGYKVRLNQISDFRARCRKISAVACMYKELDPAPYLYCVYNAVNCHHISSIAHVKLLFLRQIVDILKSMGHCIFQFLQNLFLWPIVVHVALHLLKVAAGYATCVTQKVGNQHDACILNQLVSVGSGGTVGSLTQDLNLLGDVGEHLGGDLVFQSSGNEDIHILA